MHSSIDECVSKIRGTRLAEQFSIEGCSKSEIDALESKWKIRLPAIYKDFLSAMGHCAGRFMVGTDYSYPKLLEFRGDAERLLREQQIGWTLPKTAFVFAFHQGYSFMFFDTAGGELDPAVFLYTEGETKPKEVAASFSQWLVKAVQDDIEAWQELHNTDRDSA